MIGLFVAQSEVIKKDNYNNISEHISIYIKHSPRNYKE